MAKVFISHSSKDREIVTSVLDFLQMGMGIAREEIFCTSYPNELPTGEAFITKIKEELENCEAVIFLITEQYLKSQFCLAELGAAWGLSKRIFPLLLVDFDKLEGTPLKGMQMRRLDKENDISVVYDEFCTCGVILRQCTSEYINRLPSFIRQIKVITNGEYLLEVGEDGYYHTEISAVRNVPSEYRCYKIKGHIENWEAEDAAKTDWIFYRHGVYGEFHVGDKVCFKISKTEVNNWKDIGLARNIYPADLKKEV